MVIDTEELPEDDILATTDEPEIITDEPEIITDEPVIDGLTDYEPTDDAILPEEDNFDTATDTEIV